MTRQEYEKQLEEKKKKQQQESKTNKTAREEYEYNLRQKNASQMAETVTEKLKALYDEGSSISDVAEFRAKNGNKGYQSSEVTSAWLNKISNYRSSYNSKLSEIKSILDEYGDVFDSDWLTSVNDSLNNYTNGVNSLYQNAVETKKYWSQWESAEDYNSAVNAQKEREKVLSYDIGAGQREINSLNDTLSQAQEATAVAESNNKTIAAANKIVYDATGYNTVDELKTAIADKTVYHNKATNIQKSYSLENHATTAADFDMFAAKGASLESDVAYYRDNAAKIDANALRTGASSMSEEAQIYSQMSKDEVKVYNYYLGKETAGLAPEGTAQNYLDSIYGALTERVGTNYANAMKNNTGLELLFGVAAGTDQFYQGMKNLGSIITGKEDYIPTSSKQYASGMVREDLADDGFKFLGSSVGQIAYDAITTTANMMPTIALSMATQGVSSALGATAATAGKIGSIAGNALMGASAAGNTYAELLNSGMNKSQARALALVQGAWEGASEYYLGGIEDLSNNKIASLVKSKLFKQGLEDGAKGTVRAVLEFFAGRGIDALDEGLEEVIQDLGSSVIDGIATGKWEFSSLEEQAYNFVLGALTDVGMNGFTDVGKGIAKGINTVNENSQYKNIYGGDIESQRALVNEGLASDNKSYSNKLANKYQDKLNTGKELSGNQIRKLVNANEQQFVSEDIANIKTNVSEYLNRLGETGNIALISSAITKAVAGQELTETEQTALKTSKYAARVLNELNTENIENTYLPEKISTNRINSNVYGNNRADVNMQVNTDNETETEPQKTESNKPIDTEDKPTSEAVNKPVADNNTVDNTVNKPIDNTENNPIGNTVDNPDSVEVVQPNSQEALKESIKNVDNKEISKPALDLIESEYDGTRPANEFVAGMVEGFNYGYSQIPMNAIPNNGLYSTLTDMQKRHSYQLGVDAENAKAEGRQAEINAGIKQGKFKTGRRQGVVKGENVSIADLKTTFNDTQNKAYKILSTVAEATGIDIVLFKSETDADGNFIGKQGKFAYKDNTIYIDLNAGLKNVNNASDLGKYAMLRTFSHEFVHFIEKWNPKAYNTFRNLVFETIETKGESVNDLIETKMALDDLSYDKASREVLAEAMTDILPDTSFIKTLAEENRTVFDKLLEKLKEFIGDIKDYFNSLGSNRSREANVLKEERDGQLHYFQSIVDAFDKVAVEAVKNYQMQFDDNTPEAPSKTTMKEIGTVSLLNGVSNAQQTANETGKEQTVKMSDHEVKPNTDNNVTKSDNGYTVTDNENERIITVKFDEIPNREIRDVLKKNRFWYNKEQSVWQRNGGWYNTNARENIIDALDNAYNTEQNTETEAKDNTPSNTQSNDVSADETEQKTDLRKLLSENNQVEYEGIVYIIFGVEILKGKKQYQLKTVNTKTKTKFFEALYDTREEAVAAAVTIAESGKTESKKDNAKEEVQEEAPKTKKKMLEESSLIYETQPNAGIDWNDERVITKTDKDYSYKTIDAVAVGNDLYFRFRGASKGNPKKQRFFVIQDFKLYTAQEIINWAITHSNVKTPYPLGRHFEDIIRTVWKNNGLEQGFIESTLKDPNTEKVDNATENNNLLENIKEANANETNGRQTESGEAVRTDNNGAVLQSQSDGEGASRLLDEGKAEDVQGVSGQRQAVESSSERGGQTERNGNRADTSDRVSRSEGSSESGDIRGNDVLEQNTSEQSYTPTEEEKAAKTEELKETVKEQVEQQSTETPKGKNFVIGDSLNLPKGEKARFRANVDAIKLVKKLESEGRYATPAEQEILSKYVGWGGLKDAFGDMGWNSETKKREMIPKEEWRKEFAELRQLVDDGIITEEEYKAASASTKNAHYTSIEVINAMYDGLEKLGFKGGHMLEPSSGVGNFVGGMPTAMSSKVDSWTMVELDSITGLIAKYLYPNANVLIKGFEQANIPDNFMDVAISNVPFGDYGVVDRAYPNRITKAIHNYFFAKAIDKVRPGGIVMFITSSFTMNGKDTEVRQYIMDRADLLGAIRLPNTAFKGNAGTEVVTDILILKKREKGTEYSGEAFLNSPYQQFGEKYYEQANINEYFTNHPEMVLGTPSVGRGMYGSDSLTYNPVEGKGTLGEQIKEAFGNITAKMDYPAKKTAEKINFDVQRANAKTKQNGLVVNSDGSISQNQNGELVKYDTDAATAKRIKGLLSIRDAYKKLVADLQQGQAENIIKADRKALNDIYDKFVKENGFINSPKNRSAIAEDPDSYSVYALENYDANKKTATKADIFTKDTIKPNRTVTHVDDIETGVIVSINTSGSIDASLIAKLTGKTVTEVERELIDGRLAFKRRDGSLEAPETYLSGNVRAKLKEAEALAPIDKDFENNVEELKKVIPKDIPFSDIYVTPGSPWIPNEVYADFIAEMLGGHNNPDSYRGLDVEVGKTNTGSFKIVVNNARLKQQYQNKQKWGTKRRTFLDIIQALMSSSSLTVNDTVETDDGKKKSVPNKVETAAAQAKAEEIIKEFQDWIWKDETRRKVLAALYNETYNALVNPKYSGKHLTINGLNAEIEPGKPLVLREHQADAVQRIISSGGNTLLAHKVGAGKTLEMAAAAMKLRELGIVKKPMFAVPKSLVAQWGVEFKNYFPAAKLLVADEKSFSKENRKTFTNRIANGDFDAIIVSYEQFEKIPMSVDFKTKFYQEQINEVLDAIAEEKAETKGKGLTVKEMEKKVSQLKKKIGELTKKAKDEDNINFETLGIDSLFVDEAHNFKNLQYVTRMTNVSGLGNTKGSERAFDLYTKVRYLQQLNGGRGVVFATATPVMNSMAEMYIMQKYLQSDMLNQLGLKTFDAWAKQFGEIVNAVEIKPSGQGFRVKQTFSNFKNLNELQLLFRSFSDVLTDVPGLKIPKMKGGAVKIIECEAGEFQKNYMQELEKRADNIKNVNPSEDNMLKITSDGRKVSYTQRMIDPTLPYEAGCKIYKCCENVLAEYKDSNSIKGTQIIFCDMATPKGKSKTESTSSETEADDIELDAESAKLYDDMKAYLIKKGIPAKEIAFIHDADTDAKKKQLFADVNEGKVRVLIGSTGKMGVGMNAQKRIVAIHHLDAPWRPGDVEQRDGRAFRQKNMNDEVSKYAYVTVGSFDSRLWDILDRKQHFINQIMNGENVGRTAEDTGEVTLSAAEVKAIASGNPLIGESVRLSTDLQKLEDLHKAYNSSILTAKAKLLEDEQRIAIAQRLIANAKEDIKSRVDTYSEGKFSMDIGGKNYTDKKDAGVALIAEITAKAITGSSVTVGNFAGFELKVTKEGPEYKGIVSGKNTYQFNVHINNTTYMINQIIQLVEGIETKIKMWEDGINDLKVDLAAQEKMIAEPFSKQAELEQKRSRFNEVMAILNPQESQQIVDEDSESDDSEDQYQSRAYLDETDDRYMELAKNPEANKAELQRMVDEAANNYLNSMLLPNDNDEVGFKYHRGKAPTKTFKRYAVFNVSEDGFRAAYAGNRNATPVGVWLDAQNLKSYMSDMTQFDDGTFASYIPGDTGANWKTKFSPELYEGMGVKKSQSWLLERGGKHSSDVPNFSQMNLKQDENGNKVNSAKDGALPHNKLIFEIEYGITDGGDLTDYVRENGRMMKGKNQGLAHIEPNQYYDFKTNPNAVGNWGIGGTFRIVRSVPYDEVISATEKYKQDSISEANRLFKEGKISKTDRDARIKNAKAIQVQKWVDGYNPEEFGITASSMQELVDKGREMKLTDPVTYDDNGNVIPLSQRFNPNIEDIRYQSRTDTLTDREILEIAANEIRTDDLTEGEKQALDTFQNRLGKLQELQDKRTEQGRLYKQQQFGDKVDRHAAAETLNRMHVLDSQIKTASDELLSVEEKEVLKRVLQKSRKVIERTEKERGKEILDRWRDRRRNADAIKKYRKKITVDVDELSKWILHPDNKNSLKRVPDVVKNSVIDILSSVDFTSKRQLNGGEATKADAVFTDRLNALKSAIKTNIDVNGMYSGYNELPPTFMTDLQDFIDKTKRIADNVKGSYVINEMTAEELKTLSKLIRSLKKWITQINKFHANAMYQHVNKASDNSLNTLRSMNNASDKVGELTNSLFWQQIRPAFAWERFGEGGKSIYDEFRKAQATLAFNSKQIIDFSEKTYTDAEVKSWEEGVKEFNLGGDTVYIPVSYMMSFYELSKQPDSLRHMLGEGIRVATFKNGKAKYSDNGHTLTEEDIKTIVDSLTDRQKEVADALQKYMATVGAKWGNYVSIARFGEELLTNPQYFPINSDGRHLESTVEEHPSNASLYALLNMSFTKQRQEGADNRLVIYSIFDVFANHMASMAQYNAFALPILDALKWFNYKDIEVVNYVENGKNQTMKINHGSLREELARVYGVPEESRPGKGNEGYAETFIKNIIRAYNGTETQGISTDTSGIKALRRYNMAQIAYNFRVVVQQPLAITRAGLLIDYRSIIKGLKLNPASIKANIDEMYEHSGIAAWKSLGFYDINISRGLTDIIKHNNSVLDKVNEVGMYGAEKADEITWAAMWSACKEEIKKKNPGIDRTSKKYFDLVTNLFEDVVYKTQVVDSVLTKSEFMRSKGFFSRAISSFMSEPVTTASMVLSCFDKYQSDIQKGKSRQQAWKQNGKYIARVCAVYGIGAVLLAAVQAVIDTLRDDDDDKEWYEKYWEQFAGNIIDELMPFNKLPLISDFYDIAKEMLSIFGVDTYGNPPQTIIAQWHDSLIKGTQIIYDKISGEKTNYTTYAGIAKLLQAGSGMTGLPLGTTTREVVNAWNTTAGFINPKLKVQTYVSSDEKKYRIFEAMQNGDNESIEYYRNKYTDDDAFESAKKAAIKERYSSGEIDDDTASEYLVKYCGMSESDARWQLDKWEYKKAAGTSEGYSRYDDFFSAVETGKDIKAVIKEYTDNGVEAKTLAAQITSHFKPLYLAMSNTERANIKGYLLNAYELLGYDRAEKSKDIDNWLK